VSKAKEKKWREAARRARRPSDKRKFLRLAQYEKLCDGIRACERCPLAQGRTIGVPLDQAQPKAVALVGEAPGRSEDQVGKPFVGQSGKLLDLVLEQVGASRDDVAVLNTVACRPPHNRDPKPEETEACRPWYEKQLEFSGAWVVVLMGNKALQQIFPGSKISEARGHPMWMDGRIYVPTYHPAYILRNRKQESVLVNDIRLAFQIYRGDKWWPPIVRTVAKGTKKNKELGYALEHQGWALVYSERLEDEIIVVKDDQVKVPIAHGKKIRYSMEELVRLGELGRGHRLSKGELASVHLVKSLGGTVVVQ